jgi:hypothetical protein
MILAQLDKTFCLTKVLSLHAYLLGGVAEDVGNKSSRSLRVHGRGDVASQMLVIVEPLGEAFEGAGCNMAKGLASRSRRQRRSSRRNCGQRGSQMTSLMVSDQVLYWASCSLT